MTDTSTPAAAPGDVLPVREYVARLPKERLVAGVLFRDHTGRVLLVEPTYKPNWEIPGGAVEDDESPWAGAVRECAEEMGWDRPLGRALVIDYVRPQDSRPEGVVIVFDGGLVDETDLVGMVLPASELRSVGLYDRDEVRARVKPLLADRINAALAAFERGGTVLCEQGRPVA